MTPKEGAHLLFWPRPCGVNTDRLQKLWDNCFHQDYVPTGCCGFLTLQMRASVIIGTGSRLLVIYWKNINEWNISIYCSGG